MKQMSDAEKPEFACPGCGKDGTQQRREPTADEMVKLHGFAMAEIQAHSREYVSYAYECTACKAALLITKPAPKAA